jgi:agmatinase
MTNTNIKYMPENEGFLALTPLRVNAPYEHVTYENSKVVVIPFGLEQSVSYGLGTHRGPQAMIKASSEVELFDETLWCEPFRYIKAITMVEPEIIKPLEKAVDQLEGLVRHVLAEGKFPMTFGGEHSITAGTIRPFAEKYPDLHMLHFDAHADLRDGYEGEHYSHASALRRCLDHENITLISCGIRNISQEEIPFLEANRHRIHMHWGKDIKRWNVQEIIKPLIGKTVYLTFDLDGFDASLMPATGTPEPGGMFWADAIEIIEAASKVCTIVGADINELAPVDYLHASDFLAAKLAYRILALAIPKD